MKGVRVREVMLKTKERVESLRTDRWCLLASLNLPGFVSELERKRLEQLEVLLVQ